MDNDSDKTVNDTEHNGKTPADEAAMEAASQEPLDFGAETAEEVTPEPSAEHQAETFEPEEIEAPPPHDAVPGTGVSERRALETEPPGLESSIRRPEPPRGRHEHHHGRPMHRPPRDR